MGPENSTTESIINLRCYTVVAGEPDVGPNTLENHINCIITENKNL